MNDRYDVIGPLLAEVGVEVASIVGKPPGFAFLYVEAGEGWASAGVFNEEGEVVRYFDPSSELMDLLLEAWATGDRKKRWAVMEYELRGTKFDAQFQYFDQVDSQESEIERRPPALKRRFGDKPVIYPPPPTID
jgi:hypothetical protein